MGHSVIILVEKARVRIPFWSFRCQFKEEAAFIVLSGCRFPCWEIGDSSSLSHCNCKVPMVGEAQRVRVAG